MGRNRSTCAIGPGIQRGRKSVSAMRRRSAACACCPPKLWCGTLSGSFIVASRASCSFEFSTAFATASLNRPPTLLRPPPALSPALDALPCSALTPPASIAAEPTALSIEPPAPAVFTCSAKEKINCVFSGMSTSFGSQGRSEPSRASIPSNTTTMRFCARAEPSASTSTRLRMRPSASDASRKSSRCGEHSSIT